MRTSFSSILNTSCSNRKFCLFLQLFNVTFFQHFSANFMLKNLSTSFIKNKIIHLFRSLRCYWNFARSNFRSIKKVYHTNLKINGNRSNWGILVLVLARFSFGLTCFGYNLLKLILKNSEDKNNFFYASETDLKKKRERKVFLFQLDIVIFSFFFFHEGLNRHICNCWRSQSLKSENYFLNYRSRPSE